MFPLLTTSFVFAAAALKVPAECVSRYVVTQGTQTKYANEIATQIESLKEKCGLFSAQTKEPESITFEGRVLIDVY